MDKPPQFPPADPLSDQPRADGASEPEQFSSGANSEASSTEPTPPQFVPQVLLAGAHRGQFLRGVQWVLVVAVVSFAVSWVLIRGSMVRITGARANDPLNIVRVELGSLASGDIKSGYAQLSERYRKQVSFEDYYALVTSHRRMFLTRNFRVTRREQNHGQVFIETELTSRSGRQFLAQFTLVESQGRWWIDDLHWGRPADSHALQA
jgi:hypothetical protein